ncbi:phosphodiester glycosidase family protein [Pseudobacteroides cellulosolvens]|uniref:phosphodiester glycosidase family protein n=1 Tax=Pseudobacteroides cellulosolvens TaxID=35825 RepID=UPI000AF5841F|nr:phosphodiester glycosidase family protein [Pseudobacteroides cellulosolvens]
MKLKISKKRKWITCSLAVFFIIAGVTAYKAADRYLIEHVEVDLSTSNLTDIAVNSTRSINTSSETYTTTDMSYKSDNKAITIQKVVTGSGSDQLVYFISDIQLADATLLKSAFAKDKFGTNIIQVPTVIASNNNAAFAINGDYYGFRNDGIIIRNGVLYRNSPARQGLALYKDGSMKVYDETSTSGEQLLADSVWNTLSFGPALLENGNIISGINSVEVDTNFGNHSIQGEQPRTGIGIIDKNHFIFIVADGRSRGYSKGVTITEFAQIFKSLGCTIAYNIDGGGSSEMVFMDKVVNNPLGKGRERGTSDILYISK